MREDGKSDDDLIFDNVYVGEEKKKKPLKNFLTKGTV